MEEFITQVLNTPILETGMAVSDMILPILNVIAYFFCFMYRNGFKVNSASMSTLFKERSEEIKLNNGALQNEVKQIEEQLRQDIRTELDAAKEKYEASVARYTELEAYTLKLENAVKVLLEEDVE